MAEKNAPIQVNGFNIRPYAYAALLIAHELAHNAQMRYSPDSVEEDPRYSFAYEGVPEAISLEVVKESEEQDFVSTMKADYVKTARTFGFHFDPRLVFTESEYPRITSFLDSPDIFSTHFNVLPGENLSIGTLKTLEFRKSGISFNVMLRRPFRNDESLMDYMKRVKPKLALQ